MPTPEPTPTPIPPAPSTLPTIYWESALGVIRSLLTAAAGILVTRGVIAATATNEFIQLGIGIATFLITVGWSIWTKHKQKRVLVTALTEAEMTEAEAKAKVAVGVDVPSVLTSPTVIPIPPPPKPL